MNKIEKSFCKFGTFNTITGEAKEGYVDKHGNMKYRSYPLLKRLIFWVKWKFKKYE